MIRYKKKITVSNRTNTDEWRIRTDRGDTYEMFPTTGRNIWTEWTGMQHDSELRTWQKEIFREFANRFFEDLTPYVVYKPRHGTNQAHDIAVARSNTDGTWLIATAEDFWIVPSNYGEFTVERGVNSMGAVTDEHTRRQVIYPLLDSRIFT